VLEAMSHGLPVLAPDHLALAETIEDGSSGLLFAPENMLYDAKARLRFRHVLPPPAGYLQALQAPSVPYVEGIAAAVEAMAADRELHARLAEGAFEAVRSGRLSIPRRRAALAEIYAAAAS
jgi:glycosyltransferase involved in cell wall biosynthesis